MTAASIIAGIVFFGLAIWVAGFIAVVRALAEKDQHR